MCFCLLVVVEDRGIINILFLYCLMTETELMMRSFCNHHIKEKVLAKLAIFLLSQVDDTYRQWIRKNVLMCHLERALTPRQKGQKLSSSSFLFRLLTGHVGLDITNNIIHVRWHTEVTGIQLEHWSQKKVHVQHVHVWEMLHDEHVFTLPPH